MHRRHFITTTAANAFAAPFVWARNKTSLQGAIIGHGAHPVKNCHEMAMDARNHILIFDKDNLVISASGGQQPEYEGDQADLLLQDQSVFHNVHDVCADDAGDLYACQWNADQVYPYKLSRV